MKWRTRVHPVLKGKGLEDFKDEHNLSARFAKERVGRARHGFAALWACMPSGTRDAALSSVANEILRSVDEVVMVLFKQPSLLTNS
jgi:hypothetical protein